MQTFYESIKNLLSQDLDRGEDGGANREGEARGRSMADLTKLSELLERNENFVSSTKYFDGSIQLGIGKEKIWIKAFMGRVILITQDPPPFGFTFAVEGPSRGMAMGLGGAQKPVSGGADDRAAGRPGKPDRIFAHRQGGPWAERGPDADAPRGFAAFGRRGMNPEISGRYATVQGHRLYMDTGGKPDGPPMLLIHTAGQQSLQWRFVIPYFAEKGFYALAPDLPGHGKSLLDRFTPLKSIHAFAEVLWDLLQFLRLDHPVVVGCSIGGDIALDLAVHHGSEIPAVVACQSAAFTPTFPPRPLKWGWKIPGCRAIRIRDLCRDCPPAGARPKRRGWRKSSGPAVSEDPKIYYSDLLGWIHHDLRPHLSKVTCPVLCVWGDEDYFVPRPLVEETVAGIPNARLEILNGIGHYPHLETREFNPLVERFLNSLGIGKGTGSKK